MSRKVYEDDHVVVTKFVGPHGTHGIQVTPKKKGWIIRTNPDREYAQVLVADKGGA